MKKIAVARIDDRFIHGQVVTAWAKSVKSNGILIIDNELASNTQMSYIYRAVAPVGMNLYIFNENRVVDFLRNKNDKFKRNELLIVLVKTPQVFERLISQGVKIEKIILGGMAAGTGRSRLIRNVHISKEESECFKRLVAMDVHIMFQLVPDDKEINIEKYL